MRKYRASQLNRLLACPPSHREGELEIREDTEIARTGSALHHAMEIWVSEGKALDAVDLAKEFNVSDADEIAMLFKFGLQLWDELKDYFPEPKTEVGFEAQLADDVILTGHMDLVSVSGKSEPRVLDYKSGWVKQWPVEQLKGYALGAAAAFSATKATVVVANLRDGSYDARTFETDELKAFGRKVIAAARAVDQDKYEVGDHCTFCPLSHSCPARGALVRSSVNALSDMTTDTIAGIADDGKLAEMRMVISSVEKAVKIVKEGIRDLTIARGVVDLGNGKELFMQDYELKGILPLKAWPILKEHLSREQLAGAIIIKVTAVQDAVAANTSGGKGAACAAILDVLDKVEAIKRTKHKRIQTRKRVENAEEK